MRKEASIFACPNCGSKDIEPVMLFGGPMATVDNSDGRYRCRNCDSKAVPLVFHSDEEWIYYRQSMAKLREKERKHGDFLHIPILPVDTRSLVSVGGIDMPFGKVAEVVSVQWNGWKLERTDYAVKFDTYWRAVSGKRYNAKDILLMDLAGILEGKPNFRVLRELVKKKYDVWLDLGMRSDQDIFDAFSVEVCYAMADTSLAPSIRHFEEIFELSDKCVPCIQMVGQVVWHNPSIKLRKLRDVLKKLNSIGFQEIAVFDLQRFGKHTGVSTDMLLDLEGSEANILVGGGVVEGDLERIKELGFVGAFIDPFTPIISDLVVEDEGEKSPTSLLSPSGVAAPKRNYLATD